MNTSELENLGAELIEDLEDALSDYDFVDVERDGIESDRLTDTAMYLIYVEWDWDDFYGNDDQYDPDDDPGDYGSGDQLTDEIVSIIDGVIEDWEDYEITYDWEDSSTIVVALHVDYDFDNDDEDADDEDDDDEEY